MGMACLGTPGGELVSWAHGDSVVEPSDVEPLEALLFAMKVFRAAGLTEVRTGTQGHPCKVERIDSQIDR